MNPPIEAPAVRTIGTRDKVLTGSDENNLARYLKVQVVSTGETKLTHEILKVSYPNLPGPMVCAARFKSLGQDADIGRHSRENMIHIDGLRTAGDLDPLAGFDFDTLGNSDFVTLLDGESALVMISDELH